MEEDTIKVERNLSNTCHGCLSRGREVTLLGDLSDTLLHLLGSSKSCLVYGINDIKVCWECRAQLSKYKAFQSQVRQAQNAFMKLLYEIETPAITLSKLTVVKKTYYDQDIKHTTKTTLKKNNKQLDSITIIKTEFENHSDNDETSICDDDIKQDNYLDTQNDTFINKSDTIDDTDVNIDIIDDKDNISDTDLNVDVCDKEVINVATKDEHNFDDVKTEVHQKVKKPRRRKDTKCVNNVVGYYKRYATLIKTEKKEWGSWEEVRGHFRAVLFTEKEMEDNFFIKDRRNTSYQRMPYKCDVCTLGYTKEYDLKRHRDLNHHKEGSTYKCSQCNKKQPTHSQLEYHWRTHSVIYKCKMCSDVCKENFMRKHLDHAHTKTYDCTVCHAKFKTLKSFTVHYKELHMHYVCDYCNHTLTTKVKMEKHISAHHMTYTCKDCNRAYKNYIYYKKHCYALHPGKISVSNNPELSFCVECNKQFPSVDKYKTHLRVSPKHNKKKSVSLPCPDCGKIFGRKKNLAYHYNLFHLKKTQFYCEICDKYFARPSGLRTHRENVHLKVEKVKDKICDLCGRGFASHVVLRHHRRTHTGERPHKCPHCAAEFIQKYAMQTHVRTQHKEMVKDTSNARQALPWQDVAPYFV